MKRKIVLVLLLACCAVTCILLRPTIFVVVGNDICYVGKAAEGTHLQIKFIHSVQKTPVEENLVVEGRGFRLKSTRYRSFGAGLPFLASEGNFRREGDFFIMDNMNRFYPSLGLRIGQNTDLTVAVGGKTLKLHNMYPVGTRVDIFIASYAKGMFHR